MQCNFTKHRMTYFDVLICAGEYRCVMLQTSLLWYGHSLAPETLSMDVFFLLKVEEQCQFMFIASGSLQNVSLVSILVMRNGLLRPPCYGRIQLPWYIRCCHHAHILLFLLTSETLNTESKEPEVQNCRKEILSSVHTSILS